MSEQLAAVHVERERVEHRRSDVHCERAGGLCECARNGNKIAGKHVQHNSTGLMVMAIEGDEICRGQSQGRGSASQSIQ